MSESYREPYPGIRERLYWLYIRFLTTKEVPPKAWTRLSCPETGGVIATEHTTPVSENEMGVCTYACSECGGRHRFKWGPPAPIRLTDPPK